MRPFLHAKPAVTSEIQQKPRRSIIARVQSSISLTNTPPRYATPQRDATLFFPFAPIHPYTFVYLCIASLLQGCPTHYYHLCLFLKCYVYYTKKTAVCEVLSYTLEDTCTRLRGITFNLQAPCVLYIRTGVSLSDICLTVHH